MLRERWGGETQPKRILSLESQNEIVKNHIGTNVRLP